MTGSVQIANLNVTISSLVTVAMTIVILISMGYLVDYTQLGLQLRAASADFKTARLLGVRSNRLITSSFAISGLLAAFVGFIIVVENPQVEPMFGLNITILALVGIVIGGISTLRGCALGGFIVGFILSLLNTFLGNARVYAYSYLFLAVVIILLVRPGGILSKRNEMDRV
jgi:branched-chain amino acid transport system permease protein